MSLCDEVRRHCAEVADSARLVAIDLDAAEGLEASPPPALDPEIHYLEGDREDVTAFVLTVDAINFGSGWFPTLGKPPGRRGYYTIAAGLAAHFRARRPWSPSQLRELDAGAVAEVL